MFVYFLFFFFNDTATTEIYTNLNTLSLHDALPISGRCPCHRSPCTCSSRGYAGRCPRSEEHTSELQSHSEISYAVFCLKKKNNTYQNKRYTQRTNPTLNKNNIKHILFFFMGVRSDKSDSHFFTPFFFFFNDTATTEIYTNLNTLSLHDALPIYSSHIRKSRMPSSACDWSRSEEHTSELQYAVFCL